MALIVVGSSQRAPQGVASVAADVEAIVERLARTRADGGTLLLAASSDALRAARAARSVLADPDIGLLGCVLPPTRLHLVVTALSTVPTPALGLAPAVVAAVERVSVTQALLSSVSALVQPRPGLLMDVASYLPGNAFLVDWDRQEVRRAAGLEPVVGWLTVTNRSQKPVAPVDETAWANRVEVEADGSFWGAKRWFEVSALTVPLDDAVDLALDPLVVADVLACPSCGRLAAGEACVFCQVTVSPVVEQVRGGVG